MCGLCGQLLVNVVWRCQVRRHIHGANIASNGVPVGTKGRWEKVPIHLWGIFKDVAVPVVCGTLKTSAEIDVFHPGPGSSGPFYLRYVII